MALGFDDHAVQVSIGSKVPRFCRAGARRLILGFCAVNVDACADLSNIAFPNANLVLCLHGFMLAKGVTAGVLSSQIYLWITQRLYFNATMVHNMVTLVVVPATRAYIPLALREEETREVQFAAVLATLCVGCEGLCKPPLKVQICLCLTGQLESRTLCPL